MVVPVPKINDYINDFRPISLLSSLSLLEVLLGDQIALFISSNSLLSQYQSGFS